MFNSISTALRKPLAEAPTGRRYTARATWGADRWDRDSPIHPLKLAFTFVPTRCTHTYLVLPLLLLEMPFAG